KEHSPARSWVWGRTRPLAPHGAVPRYSLRSLALCARGRAKVPTICVDGLGTGPQIARSATKARDPREKTRALVRSVRGKGTFARSPNRAGEGSDETRNGRALYGVPSNGTS